MLENSKFKNSHEYVLFGLKNLIQFDLVWQILIFNSLNNVSENIEITSVSATSKTIRVTPMLLF